MIWTLTHTRPSRAAAVRTPGRSEPTVLKVRADAIRGSGEKAARRDLESSQALGERSHFQAKLQASHEQAVHHRIEQAVADLGLVDEELADIEREQEWRQRDISAAEKRLEKAVGAREAIPEPRRFLGTISNSAYFVVMLLFAAVEYPLLRLSLVRLPVDDATIKVIAVLIGATLVAGVHVLALAASRVVEHEGDRIESRRDWLAHRGIVIAGATFYGFIVIGLAWVRAGEINGIDKSFTGQGLAHPVWLGIALGFLHAATLLAAFYVAYQRARGAQWRAAQELVERREQEKKEADAALEELDRREARLHVQRDNIIDRADRDLEQLHRHHAVEEKAYLAILARSIENPPKSIDDWDTSRTPRERHVPPVRTLTKTVPSNGRRNGHTSARVNGASQKS
jgi:hypothetical protein